MVTARDSSQECVNYLVDTFRNSDVSGLVGDPLKSIVNYPTSKTPNPYVCVYSTSNTPEPTKDSIIQIITVDVEVVDTFSNQGAYKENNVNSISNAIYNAFRTLGSKVTFPSGDIATIVKPTFASKSTQDDDAAIFVSNTISIEFTVCQQP